jgi:hypothetical protein
MEPGEFHQMMEDQDYKCPLCTRSFPRPDDDGTEEDRVAPAVDHCHESLKVRGILCVPCNRVIGYLENPDWYGRACDYLGWD